MYGLRFVDVAYCKYGMQYRPRTKIWGNVARWTPRPLCICDCNRMHATAHKHIQSAQRGRNKVGAVRNSYKLEQQKLRRILAESVHYIFLVMYHLGNESYDVINYVG